MIRYALRCDKDHSFDSWFRDSGAYDALAAAGALSCPECGSTAVSKAIMAPRLGRRLAEPSEAPGASAAPVPDSAAAPAAAQAVASTPGGAVMPESEKLRLLLRELRRQVEANCDYVGPAFAEEARRIHKGESERRGIYGEASPEEAEALAEEGVEVARIPWIPRDDA